MFWLKKAVFFLIVANLVIAERDSNSSKIVTCYFSSWSVYRPNGGSFLIENIDPTLCTHIVYAFAGLNTTDFTIRSLDPWQDLEDNYGKGGFKRATNGLKLRNPHLKVLLAIGGWNEGSINYSNLASDQTKRLRFVDSVINFIQKYNFDGLDLDWEYPAKRGGSDKDKDNFVLLVSELRQSFDKHNYILTAALGASKDTIDIAYDVEKLSKLLDYLHIMCYDYHGAWDRKIGPNAPLYGAFSMDHLNIEFTIKYLKSLNVKSEKIILGVPFYGRTFITDKNHLDVGDVVNLNASAKEFGFPGIYTKENGFMGYNEICLELDRNVTWTQIWHDESKTAFLYKDNKVIAYDDEQSIEDKVKYALSEQLGGIMVWSIDTDDFAGHCNLSKYHNYPLLRTINDVILNYKEIDGKKNAEPSAATTYFLSHFCNLFAFLVFGGFFNFLNSINC